MNTATSQALTEQTFTWHILGAGSLGLLWAADFADSDIQYQLLLSNKQAADFVGEFQFTELDGKKKVYPCNAVAIDTFKETPQQLLVSTKARDTIKALESIRSHINANCKIVLLQNGLGIQQQVCELFPQNSVYCGVITHGVWRASPLSAIHAGSGHCLLGCLQQGSQHSDIEQLPSSRLNITLCENIEFALWQKLLINAVINPLTVRHQCLNGELASLASAEIEALCKENINIAGKCGQSFDYAELLQQVYSVIANTAKNRSSMLSDIQGGKQTEITYINGYLLKMAKQHHLSAPLNQALFDFVINSQSC